MLGGGHTVIVRNKQKRRIYAVHYRDPTFSNTYKVYDARPEILKLPPEHEREMDKYILGTLQGLDAPKWSDGATARR